jgi:hypothetical protein
MRGKVILKKNCCARKYLLCKIEPLCITMYFDSLSIFYCIFIKPAEQAILWILSSQSCQKGAFPFNENDGMGHRRTTQISFFIEEENAPKPQVWTWGRPDIF